MGLTTDGGDSAGGGGGFAIDSAHDNTIGGSDVADRNVISGNDREGLDLQNAADNLIAGNFIGTDATGSFAVPNGSDGVRLEQGSAGNTIGGTAADAGNVIAFNEGNGVTVGQSATDTSEGDAILQNSIFANAQLGIDLGDDGVTANDSEGHTGPNAVENFPVLSAAYPADGTTLITGTLSASPDTNYRVEFFSGVIADSSGYGQGQTLLMASDITTDDSGAASFAVETPTPVPIGTFISATATDPSGNTSEFSADILSAPEAISAVRPLPGFDANTLGPSDDGTSSAINLPFSLNFLGVLESSVYVDNNGNITFDTPLSTYTPFDLTSTNHQIIAPFFADVDTRGSGSGVVTYGIDTVDGHTAFGVDYFDVGYYGEHTDKLNVFQVILIDRSDTGAGNFDIELNYDSIQWETGDASGGHDGLGGSSARAGFSNGTGDPGTFYELPGSAVNGALLDSNPATGLINNSLGSTVPGRYVFSARNGSIKRTVVLDSLSQPTITYGTATTTLAGHISSGASIPSGEVDLTLNGLTQHAAIDPATGDFSTQFDTSMLGVVELAVHDHIRLFGRRQLRRVPGDDFSYSQPSGSDH